MAVFVFDLDNLKEKKKRYEKKEKVILGIIYLCFFLIEVPYVLFTWKNFSPSVWIIVFLVGTVLIAGIVLIAFLIINDRLSAPFSKELGEIVGKYKEEKDAQGFYVNLQNMTHVPRSIDAEIIWYVNISTALFEQGKKQEALTLLNQLEEVSTEKQKKLIQRQKEYMIS